MTEQTPLKTKLRGKLLGRNSRRTELLILSIDDEEVQIEVREPTVADREAIFEAGGIAMAQAMLETKAGEAPRAKINAPVPMFIECCLRCCFVPNTGERLFVEQDRDELFDRPAADANGWMSRIAVTVMRLMGEEVREKKATADPSQTTTSDSSSSESPKPPINGTSIASPPESSPPS